MRTILLVVTLLAHSFLLSAQISFTNPGFEGTWTFSSPPPDWVSCGHYSAYTQPLPMYKSAYQGNTYLGIESGNPDSTIESAGQKLLCNLVEGKMHHFSLYTYHTHFALWGSGNIELWAGNKVCSKEKLLWSAPVVDTIWTELNASFIPDSNYNYMLFLVVPCDTCFQVAIGIDDLSEITVDNYNLLSLPFADTAIKKGNCVNLMAESDDTTGHFNWSSIPTGFNANGNLVSVCPTQNTKYVCTITSGCGWQKSDTVNVEVTPNGVKEIQGGEYLSIYPNPTSNLLKLSNLPAQTTAMQYSIINTLGQVKQSNTLTPGNTSASINVSTLLVGVYFIRLTGSKGLVWSCKFVKE